jgi:hypothetical protein
MDHEANKPKIVHLNAAVKPEMGHGPRKHNAEDFQEQS